MESEEVTVYSFLLPTPEDQRHATFKATREAIKERFRGIVLEGTAERVERAQLDAHGRYRRVATGWGELDS